MLIMYLLYSFSSFVQGIFSAKLSQSVVGKMRQELFDQIVDLPIRYMDRHSAGDVMSRMTNDIENIGSDNNRKYITIIYDKKNKEVQAVSWIWYQENCNERLSDGYLRYENIIDLIRDAYYDDYRVTMITVQTVLREYVI